MPVVVRSDANGNVVLPARAVLAGLPKQLPSRHRELGLRHPLGTYNTSVAVVAKRVTRVVNLLRTVVPETGPGHTESPEQAEALLESHEALLQGLMQHMDDCINILRGLTVDRRDFDKSRHVKVYRRAVDQYRSHIGKVAGRIKHRQGRLTLLTARLGARSFAGYFVAVGLAEGGVGPDPDIHKHGWTAFSFNRDLRFHLCHVFLTSARLARAVEGLTGASPVDAEPVHDALTDSVVGVIGLPETYFPDEYEEPRPVLRFETGQDASHQLVADFVLSKGWRPFAGQGFQLKLATHGDGSTRSWKVPYFGRPPAAAS